MKHRDLLGITVDALMDNYVHVYMEQDGDYGYYVGIMHIDDANKLSPKYMVKDIFDLPLLHDILTGEVLELGDLND